MAELQGAKVAVNDAKTGHVIEFELVRVGTLREFRELLKAHEELTAKNAQLEEASRAVASAVKGVAEARDTALDCVEEITRQRDEAKAALTAVERAHDETQAALEIANAFTAEQNARRVAIAAEIEAHKSTLEQLLPDLLGAIGELHED